MAFRFEKINGRTMVTGPTENPSVVEKYRATRHFTDVLPLGSGASYFGWIADYAIFVIPKVTYLNPLGPLYLQDIKITENWYAREYMIDAPYGPEKRDVGAYQLTVDLIGGTVHVTAGTRINGYGPDEVDNGGLIGVDGDEVHGVDIPAPEMKIIVRFRHPAGKLNKTYIDLLSEIIGYPNKDTFLGYAPGEVMYLGGPFTESESEATATYSFAISRKRTNFVVGGITVGEKDGWDVLSPTYKDDTHAGRPVKKLSYIEIIRPADRDWKDYVPRFGWGA